MSVDDSLSYLPDTYLGDLSLSSLVLSSDDQNLIVLPDGDGSSLGISIHPSHLSSQVFHPVPHSPNCVHTTPPSHHGLASASCRVKPDSRRAWIGAPCLEMKTSASSSRRMVRQSALCATFVGRKQGLYCQTRSSVQVVRAEQAGRSKSLRHIDE